MWAELDWVGFDTETTGVQTKSDRIVSAAVVDMRDGDRTWLINPGVPIPAAATAVHRITDEMVQANGADPAQALEEIADCLVAAMRQGRPIVAFNGAFDLSLLNAELARHGLKRIEDRLDGEFCHLVDPLIIDRALDKYRRGKRNLGLIAQHYDVAPDGELHNALADVRVTLGVLQAIVERYPQIAAMSLAELAVFQSQAYSNWARGFNEWLERNGKIPDVETIWCPLG